MPKKENPPKEEPLEFRARVIEACKGGMFRVKVDDSDKEILCAISGKIRKNNVRIILNDEVDIEVSPYNLLLGRIVFRYKS